MAGSFFVGICHMEQGQKYEEKSEKSSGLFSTRNMACLLLDIARLRRKLVQLNKQDGKNKKSKIR